jgi:hypothetical protein
MGNFGAENYYDRSASSNLLHRMAFFLVVLRN